MEEKGYGEINFTLPEEANATQKQINYQRKRSPKTFFIIIMAALIGMASGFGGGILAINLQKNAYTGQDENAALTQEVNAVTNINTNTTLDIGTAITRQILPSVVGVKTTTTYNTVFGPQQAPGLGTGVIVDAKGYILTNSHVVMDGNTNSIIIQLSSGKEVPGELLWNEKILDLAIIRIDEPNLQAAELGDSDDIQVGSYALAIGNPFGMAFERSVTQGIISGLNRSISTDSYSMEGMIQTDASINEGNSGGPLINSKGEVIGINTVKVKSGEGLGFAIPVNIAKPIVDEFKEKGQFTRSYIGIKGIELEQYMYVYKGEDVGTDEGIFVYNIFENSPAATAGIRTGDVITHMNETKITTMSQLSRELYKLRPGDTARLTIIRDKKEITKEVKLAEMPKS